MKIIVLFIIGLLVTQLAFAVDVAVEEQDVAEAVTALQQNIVEPEDNESINWYFWASIFLGVLIAIFQFLQNKKLSSQNEMLTNLTSRMDDNITLLGNKVFGSLYSIGDTVRSMLEFITITDNSVQSNNTDQVNDLYLMAYWLWFGIDDQWHKESDIRTILDSELHRTIENRLLSHKARGGKSKTVIIIFDPVTKKEQLMTMLSGIISYKAADNNWNIDEDKIKEYSESIYEKYVKVINDMNGRLADCGKGDSDELYFSDKIPNIIFAQRYNDVRNGISFLGEIDFLNHRFESAQKKSTSPDTEPSEFFGFQTHDSRMVASLIKQIDLVKAKYCSDKNRLTISSSGQ